MHYVLRFYMICPSLVIRNSILLCRNCILAAPHKMPFCKMSCRCSGFKPRMPWPIILLDLRLSVFSPQVRRVFQNQYTWTHPCFCVKHCRRSDTSRSWVSWFLKEVYKVNNGARGRSKFALCFPWATQVHQSPHLLSVQIRLDGFNSQEIWWIGHSYFARLGAERYCPGA